jgi:hypothetical protein
MNPAPATDAGVLTLVVIGADAFGRRQPPETAERPTVVTLHRVRRLDRARTAP